MAVTRKAVRDAIVEMLSDDTAGFNAKLAAVADDYDITAFTIDWGSGSKQFVQQALDPSQIEPSQVIEFPGAILYTSLSQNTNDVKFRKFSGQIVANLDFYIDQRTALESQNTENIADAIEDVLIEILNDPLANWSGAGVDWSGAITCQRESIRLDVDGYSQRIPFQLTFEVNA